MSLGPIGNFSAAAQTSSDTAIKKSESNGANSVRFIYGDNSKTATLASHINRMMGFYTSLKPLLNGEKIGNH